MVKNTLSKNDTPFDALIVGAGVAGCASAHELNSKGWKVAVLHGGTETSGTESITPEGSKRLGALSIRHGTPLSQVIAWWGSATPGSAPCPGARIIQREELTAEMQAAIVGLGIPLINIKSIIGLRRTDGVWCITCAGVNGEKVALTARYLVDATGRSSVVGRMVGARRENADQLCCVSVPIDAPSVVGAWTEAVSDGWWNFCSDGKRGTLSFYTSPCSLAKVKRDIRRSLAQSREIKRLAMLPLTIKYKARPCRSSRLVPCAGAGWLAVGDAAMTVQPLTSAGVATALRDAEDALLFLSVNPRKYDGFRKIQFADYLRALAEQYALEMRWPNSTFWQSSQTSYSLPLRAALVHRDPLVGGEETPEGWGGTRRLWGKFAEP